MPARIESWRLILHIVSISQIMALEQFHQGEKCISSEAQTLCEYPKERTWPIGGVPSCHRNGKILKASSISSRSAEPLYPRNCISLDVDYIPSL